MAGSSSFDPYEVPLTLQAITVTVTTWNGTDYTTLPNIRCLSIQEHEGASPQAARFEYIFDSSDPDSPYPIGIEETWPLSQIKITPYVIGPDDRIVVFGRSANGTKKILFDGFAQIPQANMSPNHQSVTFSATGVAIRLWDKPIGGAVYRQSDHPSDDDFEFLVPTNLPTRFNPHVSGKSYPNKTFDTTDTTSPHDSSVTFPAFFDYKVKTNDPQPQSWWTLGGAIRYLLTVRNSKAFASSSNLWSFNNEPFIDNPDFSVLDALLKNYTPNPEDGFIDPSDSSTYTTDDITIRDFDATNKPLPVVLEELLGYHGFGMRFALDDDGHGNPWNIIEIYRKDGNGNPRRQLYLQPQGDDLDPGQTNCSTVQLARDHHQPANQFLVEAGPIEYEVSLILAPLFAIVVGDALTSVGASSPYLASALAAATQDARKKYRWFGVDETGNGHWDFGAVGTSTTPFDFTEIFGQPVNGVPVWVRRLRVAKSTLVSKNDKGQPRAATLAISRDYAGAAPDIWDGSGTWQDLATGGWKFLKEQIGIELTAKNPEGWQLPSHSSTQQSGEKLSVVKSLASPDTNTGLFYFRLTCVIDGDTMLTALAKKRASTPTQFAIQRTVDCRDHFKLQIVDPSSQYSTSEDPVKLRDDTEKATDYAEALRAAHEFPSLAGSFTVPFITLAYAPGDQISGINGRDIGFQVNAGQGGREAARYPVIVSRTWDFASGQQTVHQLTDRRAEPERARQW